MRRLFNLLILLAALLPFSAFSSDIRNVASDSLLLRLKTAKDTARVDVYNQLSYEYRRSNSEFSLAYSDTAISLAKRINYLRGVGNGYINRGNYFKSTGDNVTARSCFIWAYVQHNNIGNKAGMASALNAFASLHFLQGNLSQALTFFIKSLTLSEEVNDRRGVAITLNNIGVINLEQKNFGKALEYYERAYHTFNEIKDYNSMADALINIGNIYHTQGILDESLKYYSFALDSKESVGDEKGKSSVLNNIGMVYSEKGDHNEALKYYHRSLSIDEKLNDKQSITISCNSIAGSYLNLKMYFAAKKYCERALELEKQQNDKIDMVNTYELLSEIEDALGNYKTALEYYKLHTVYRDSLYSEEARQKLEDIEAQYQAGKSENARLLRSIGKEVEASEENAINDGMTRNIIIVSLVLIAFVAGMYVVFFMIRKNK